LTNADRVLARLAAAIAARDPQALQDAVDHAAEIADSEAVEEVLLQSYLFVGFPVALEAVALWRQRSGLAAPEDRTEDAATWRARGEAVCATVYGGQYGRLRSNVASLHPAYERWMLEEGYGKVLGRPGMTLRMRELCIVAQLAALGAPRQLHSHLRGARNAGAADDEIEAALQEAAAVSSVQRAREAWSVWTSVGAQRTSDSGH
jgi:4-carboxymuconolactone decarboxylase